MPEGCDTNENLMDYVLGKEDGLPRDAEWASEICGVPPERIRWLARLLATTEHAAICTSGGVARVDNADTLPLRSEEHTSELQSLMRISYAVFCLKKKKNINTYIIKTERDNSNMTIY